MAREEVAIGRDGKVKVVDTYPWPAPNGKAYKTRRTKRGRGFPEEHGSLFEDPVDISREMER